MGEKVYITRYDKILGKVRNLSIKNIIREETPCNLDDIIIVLSDNSELHIHDDMRVVHHSFE